MSLVFVGWRAPVLALLILVGSSSLVRADGETDQGRVEKAAREFLKHVYERDFDAILAMVPRDGLNDSDAMISKATIAGELRDSNSYLHKKLYAPLSTADLTVCVEKLKGKTYGSPAAFYALYGDEFRVASSRIEEFEGVYFGIGFESGKQKRLVNGCEIQLWSLTFRKIGADFYLASYFFD